MFQRSEFFSIFHNKQPKIHVKLMTKQFYYIAYICYIFAEKVKKY